MKWGLRGGILLLALLALYAAVAAWSAFTKERLASAELRIVGAEHQELVEREVILRHAVESLATPRGVEATIRERYPVVKPGEEVITLVSPKPGTASTTPSRRGILDSVKHWLGL